MKIKNYPVRIVTNGEKFAAQFNRPYQITENYGFLKLKARSVEKENPRWDFFTVMQNPFSPGKTNMQTGEFAQSEKKLFNTHEAAEKWLVALQVKFDKQEELNTWILATNPKSKLTPEILAATSNINRKSKVKN